MSARPAARVPRARATRAKTRWTGAHVQRLFWRAGFGATPSEVRYWKKRGKSATVRWLMQGGTAPTPKIKAPRVNGSPLDPINVWGHDVLWWLDQMIRSPRPLVEKMTLFWHDHFATNDQQRPLMLAQNQMFRRNALGSFPDLLRAVTEDPAMALFLSLADSDLDAPNENYARELMELFTLGTGYGENDIREAARALTGFRSEWSDSRPPRVTYDPERHDGSTKRIFGQSGRYAYRDVLSLCVRHPNHAGFLVDKLWAFFVGETPPSSSERRTLVSAYVRSGWKIAPLVEAILTHPKLYADLTRPDMVKSPVVFVAGSMRTLKLAIRDDYHVWLLDRMGQLPFDPPSVAGWDWGPAWMSTSTMAARFDWVNRIVGDEGPIGVRDKRMGIRTSWSIQIAKARKITGEPWVSTQTKGEMKSLARKLMDRRRWQEWEYQRNADMCQRALRHLLLSGPDAQVH